MIVYIVRLNDAIMGVYTDEGVAQIQTTALRACPSHEGQRIHMKSFPVDESTAL